MGYKLVNTVDPSTSLRTLNALWPILRSFDFAQGSCDQYLRLRSGRSGPALFNIRNREQDATKQQVGPEQGPEDIKELRPDKCQRRPAAFGFYQVAKPGF